MIPIIKPFLGEEEVQAAAGVIRSGWLVQGPKVQEFEEQFKKYVGAPYACAVSNCTTALHLALLAVGVKCGDVVITVSHSFIATANSIRYCGAEPVFIDIDLNTYNISIEGLKKCLEKDCRTKKGRLFYRGKRVSAILAVHQMGMPCDLKSILSLAKKYHLPVVEDAACAIGSEYQGEKIGKPHGDIACFSFHPRKIMTMGEGGMITTKNAKYDKLLRLLRHQGMSVSDLKRHQSKKIIFETYPVLGYNYRLTDIQAAVGIEQLKKLPQIIEKRRKLAFAYQNKLAKIAWLETLIEPEYAKTNWQSFPVWVDKKINRNDLMQQLLEAGIATRSGIMNSHEQPVYLAKKDKLPKSEEARRRVMILPLYHQMTDNDIDFIVDKIRNYL